MFFFADVLLPISHIPRCIHAKTPDFPRLFEPRDYKMAKLVTKTSSISADIFDGIVIAILPEHSLLFVSIYVSTWLI